MNEIVFHYSGIQLYSHLHNTNLPHLIDKHIYAVEVFVQDSRLATVQVVHGLRYVRCHLNPPLSIQLNRVVQQMIQSAPANQAKGGLYRSERRQAYRFIPLHELADNVDCVRGRLQRSQQKAYDPKFEITCYSYLPGRLP